MGDKIQIISPQNAYVMTSLLKKTVEAGTLTSGTNSGSKLAYRDESGNRYRIPSAGKTGTTQNWSDAWTVGYTPYYTTAIWFGFDKPGNSLGLSLTGATLAGPVWGDYMRDIHTGLPMKDLIRPSSGLVDVTVCAESGQLRTDACPRGVTLTFLAGTQPTTYCDMHLGGTAQENRLVASAGGMRLDTLAINENAALGTLRMPELQVDLLMSLGVDLSPAGRQASGGRQAPGGRTPARQTAGRQDSGRDEPAGELSPPGSDAVPEAGAYDLNNSETVPELPVEIIDLYPLPESGPELPSYNPLLD
jgi:penicillin-binding protein 1A